MNIKKIIQEEINDFEWIEGVSDKPIHQCPDGTTVTIGTRFAHPQNLTRPTEIIEIRIEDDYVRFIEDEDDFGEREEFDGSLKILCRQLKLGDFIV